MQQGRLAGRLVEAAEQAGDALAAAVSNNRGEENISTGAGLRAREAFFTATQTTFEAQLRRVVAGRVAGVPEAWLKELRRVALGLFDSEVMPGLADLSETRRQKAVSARRSLLATFTGHNKVGGKLFKALVLEPPIQKRKPKAETAA